MYSALSLNIGELRFRKAIYHCYYYYYYYYIIIIIIIVVVVVVVVIIINIISLLFPSHSSKDVG